MSCRLAGRENQPNMESNNPNNPNPNGTNSNSNSSRDRDRDSVIASGSGNGSSHGFEEAPTASSDLVWRAEIVKQLFGDVGEVITGMISLLLYFSPFLSVTLFLSLLD